MIFEAYNRSDSSRPFSSSKGNQTKYHINDKWYKEDYLGYESASEYLCSQILKYSNISSYVDYAIIDLQVNEQETHFCVSNHFLKPGEQLHTLHELWEKVHGKPIYKEIEDLSTIERIQAAVEFLTNDLGIPDAGEALTYLLEFDAFVLNEDRHFNNIAFIERQDGSFCFSPVFDNGAAFLSDMRAYEPGKNTHFLVKKVKAKPFSANFDKQVCAAQALYGRQLEVLPVNLDYAFAEIASYYGVVVANRMKVIYETQREKHTDFFRMKPIRTVLQAEQEPLQEEEPER